MLTPFRIQKFLAGLRYPATRDQVLQRARVCGADEAVMGALLRLADSTYESPISVSSAIGRPGSAGGVIRSLDRDQSAPRRR